MDNEKMVFGNDQNNEVKRSETTKKNDGTGDAHENTQNLDSSERIRIAELSSADNKQFLAAIGAGEQFRQGDTPAQVVIEEITEPSPRLCRWLIENCAPDTNVIFKNDAVTEELYRHRLKKMEENGVPQLKYHQLRKSGDNPGDIKSYRLNDIKPEQRKQGAHYAYGIGPYNNAAETNRNAAEVQIRRISDRESLEAYREEMEDLGLFEVSDLASLLENFYFVEDKCRWSQCSCRAVKMQSPVIDQNENIRPCLSGCKVGDTTDSPEDMRQRLKELQIETEKRRGCEQCEVKYECSRCLYLPDYLEEKEYCMIRREFPQLHRAVEARRIAALLMLQIRSKRIQAAQTNELQISGLSTRMFYREEPMPVEPSNAAINKGFMMVRLNNDFFLYDINRQKLLRMNDKMAAIFEILESTPYDAENTKSRLSQIFQMSPGEAGALLHNALQMLRQLNVIS